MSVCIIEMEYPESYGDPINDEEFVGGMVLLFLQCQQRGVRLKITLGGEEITLQRLEGGNA